MTQSRVRSAEGSDQSAPGLALYASFFMGGVGTVILGPLIPEMLGTWGVSRPDAAVLFPAQFIGVSVGAVVSGLRLRRSIRVGYALLALGLLGLSSGVWWLAPPSAGILGIGLGLALPATNLVVAARNPERPGAALSMLNLIWGLGAVGCPVLFAVARNRFSPLLLLAAMTLAMAITWSLLLRSLPRDAGATTAATELRLDSGSLWLSAMLFLYIGAETAASGWLVALADELSGRATSVSMLVVAAFWVALLAGRLAAPRLLESMSERSLHRGTTLLALIGLSLVVLADGPYLLLPAAALTGLGFAPLYPLSVSLISTTTTDAKAGPIFAFGGLGGAAIPWLTAQGAELIGSLRWAFLLPIATLALHLLLEVGYRRTTDGGLGSPHGEDADI